MLLADSLINGFISSNAVGRGIVIAQLVGSVVMVATIIGKWKELKFVGREMRRFLYAFTPLDDVLGYYLANRPAKDSGGLVGIYARTCERLLKLITPDTRSLLAAREPGATGVLNERHIELVKGACDHALDEAESEVETGMGIIATVVSLSPMLGLLGTVWGVLDAFAEMGTAGSASLATIAPSISAALVTTVVGLLIAIPGVVAYNRMSAIVRDIHSDMEGFADELIGRIACEFQGKGQ